MPNGTDCIVIYYRVIGHMHLIKAEKSAKQLGIPIIYLGATNIGIFCKQIIDGLMEDRNKEMVNCNVRLREVRALVAHEGSTVIEQC